MEGFEGNGHEPSKRPQTGRTDDFRKAALAL
jgi:hypothetical protein